LEARILLILTSLNLLDYLDRYLVAALGSPIKAEFDLSGKAFGFLNTAFILVYFVTSPCSATWGTAGAASLSWPAGAVLWSLATSLTLLGASYPCPGGGPGSGGGG
jgi:MFS transporter, Spinster family, sphingosine-1-phosphate transporter